MAPDLSSVCANGLGDYWVALPVIVTILLAIAVQLHISKKRGGGGRCVGIESERLRRVKINRSST